jgi:hypothetical protein
MKDESKLAIIEERIKKAVERVRSGSEDATSVSKRIAAEVAEGGDEYARLQLAGYAHRQASKGLSDMVDVVMRDRVPRCNPRYKEISELYQQMSILDAACGMCGSPHEIRVLFNLELGKATTKKLRKAEVAA